MTLIDFILNIAALLLWISWRMMRAHKRSYPAGPHIISTVKSTDASKGAGWHYLLALVVLLIVRSVFYYHIGASLNWQATLDLRAIVLTFRSDHLDRMTLFSVLSFGAYLAGFYVCLLLISAVNQSAPLTQPWHAQIAVQLGFLHRLPATVKLLLPIVAATILWAGLLPYLANRDLLPPPGAAAVLWKQAAVLSLGAYLAWEYLIAAVLALYLINSYVYLGGGSFWAFIDDTGRSLLKPISWIPLRVFRIDFAPIIGIIITILLANAIRALLPNVFFRITS